MEYGKPFGVGASGGVVILGTSIGYGWVILGAITITVGVIVGIRYWFRHSKSLGIK